jgi:hypothetical protein
MAKDKLTDYDATASNNTDVGGISVAEGMLPSAVNNAIREQMSHLKDFAAGTTGIDVLSLADDDASHAIKLQAPSAVTADTTFTLPDGDGVSGQTMITDGAGTLAWAAPYGNRNLIINGKFSIFQRGAGATTVNGNDVFAADRFKGWANGGGTYTVEQSTDVPNNEFEYSAKLTNTATDGSVAAGDFYAYATDIEGYNVSQLAYGHSDAKAVTLSFWVKSSLAGTYCIALYSTTANRSHIKEYTISSANTWEKKTITISSGDTTGSWNRTNGNGLRVYWDLGSGSTYQASADTWLASQDFSTTNQAAWIGSASATFFITGVQLEVGSGPATPFEHRSFGDELAACQRYYYQLAQGSYMIVGMNDTTSNCETTFGLPVEMRADPTLGTSGTSSEYSIRQNGSNIACDSGPTILGAGGKNVVGIRFTKGSGLNTSFASYCFGNTSGADLKLDAEL